MLKNAWELIKETFKDWSEDKAPRLAAALAYYTIFSIAPLLVLAISIAGFVIGNNQTIQDQLITQITGLVGADAAGSVEEMITTQLAEPRANFLAAAVGIITLLMGATGLFGQLQDALNTIWEVKPKEGRGILGMLKDRFLSFTMILGVSFILLVSLVISSLISALGNFISSILPFQTFLMQVVNFVISMAIITLIFAMIFKILPDVDIAWGDVWIGAFVTALLFNIGKLLIGLYIGNSAVTSAYGAAGSLVVILLWIYYSAQILFLGAEFTQVYSRRHGSRIEPSANAQRITEMERAKQGMTRLEQEELDHIRDVMIPVPVTGQPQLRAQEQLPGLNFQGSKVRYEPKNPAAVVPVIAAGTLAGVASVVRVASGLRSLIPRRPKPQPSQFELMRERALLQAKAVLPRGLTRKKKK